METKIATEKELVVLKKMFYDASVKMMSTGLDIWDEYYPAEVVKDDIAENRMYIVEHEDEILSAYVLFETDAAEKLIEWEENSAKPAYLYRFAVNPSHLGEGLGKYTLSEAEKSAREMGAKYLRLFVVDTNIPAMNLYLKCGYEKRNGYYDNHLDGRILREYGFEKRL